MHDTRRERSNPRRAPSLHVRPAVSRSFANSRLLRVAFRTRLRPCATWPGDAGLPSFVARRRSWGSIPSQVSSRLRVDARHTFDATHPQIPGLAAQDPGFQGSAFLPVRAHLPFVPPRPPRLIFVGVTDRLLEKRDLQKRSAGDSDGVDFWALAPVCDPPPEQLVGPGARSCLGLCLLQGCRALGRASARARPRYPIIRPRNARGQRVSPRLVPIRSWDSTAPSGSRTHASSCSTLVT